MNSSDALDREMSVCFENCPDRILRAERCHYRPKKSA